MQLLRLVSIGRNEMIPADLLANTISFIKQSIIDPLRFALQPSDDVLQRWLEQQEEEEEEEMNERQ